MPSVNRFPTTVSFASKTSTNVNGACVTTYQTSFINIPALLVSTGGGLRLTYQQRAIGVSHTVYITATVTTNPGDIMVDSNGQQYYVQSSILDISGTGRIFQFAALVVQGPGVIIEE